MARHSSIATHVSDLLGTAVVATNTVAGGEICVATRARLSDGRSVFVKARPGAPVDFFAAEARALRWLAEAGPDAAPIPAVLGQDEDCLVLEWIEAGRPSAEAAEAFGRALAATHRSGAPSFGAAADGYVGTLPQPNTPTETWPEFYASCRIEPYLRTAFNRGALLAEDAKSICAVLEVLTELAGPPEPPARLHGDLWSGNIVWSIDGMPKLVDPTAYGGHRETDLAMLGLFGAPYLDRVIGAYEEVYPLAEGWRERAGLHQLHPLLVHAGHFGGGYGARAGRVARDILAERATPTVSQS